MMTQQQKDAAYARILKGDSFLTPGFLQRMASKIHFTYVDYDPKSGGRDALESVAHDLAEVIEKEIGSGGAEQFLEDCGLEEDEE